MGIHIKRKLLADSIKVLRVALLFVVFLSFTIGWVQTLGFIPSAQRVQQQDHNFVQALLSRGITHIYTDYWTCDRIAFESAERIICSVVDEQLQPGNNRYTPYVAIVKSDPHASWVFPLNSPQANTFAQNMKKSGETHPPLTLDGYLIYTPPIH